MATDKNVEETKLDSSYNPQQIEKALYAEWEQKGLFTPKADGNHASSYTIILPPPNVTGVLHMGHALTCTIEDILIRRQRMEGKKALWVPGTDHAGIATQMVVERKLLKEEKKSRHDLGREKFLEKVWEWKEQSQGTILHQLRLMGCSLDWSRLAFTLDENVSAAVRECFVRLFNEGLIYREMAITQWCPRCHTALSDLEVKAKETKGKFWHIKYVLKDNPSQFLIVATTRPETLLGDTAVAIHPEDERFTAFRGKKVLVPLINREVPVIQDSYVDKTFGTGALKITPAHDPNDYAIGKKHNLPLINIFDESAVLNKEAGPYTGLNREKGREKVLSDLASHGLLVKEEDHLHNVGHCDRCGTMVEPRVSQQWFVRAEELAKDAIRVVESGEIKIVPKEWEKTYFEWMRNIRPWCISRQLWWGHRIPVWYCQDCSDMQAATAPPTKCLKCGSARLTQDDDVLDTWFSSGLWPISTLGWPKKTADLDTFYPTSVMETGFDILFFWVARMVMLCMKMTGKIPFHTVYLHPMVRDEHGQKMSKTKGNVVDPLEIAEKKGADALRFFLTWNAYHGRDLRVSDDGVEGFRNFANKVWNASRFVLMHFGDLKERKADKKNPVNGWIFSRLNQTKRDLNIALDEYRFFEAAQTIYHFIWNDYCDWFIELMKPEMENRKQLKDSTALEVLEESLRLLHPFMPFLTEKIWLSLPIREAGESISLAKYPKPEKSEDREALASVSDLIDVTEKIRTTRGIYEIPLTKDIEFPVVPMEAGTSTANLASFAPMLKHLARAIIKIEKSEPNKKDYLAVFSSKYKIFIPKSELPDLEKEIARRKKELEDKKSALARAEEKLKNEKFMNSAPEQVRAGVIKTRDDLVKSVSVIEQYLKDVS
jgi:valyl-tRNA synthetase